MELNLEELRAKLEPAVTALIEHSHKIDPENTPVAIAVQGDLHLSMFLIFAMDFVGATPTAVISGDAIEQLEGGEVRMVLPIPQMFESYYSMRLAKFQAGQVVTPEDTIVTPMGVTADNENVVISAEVKPDGR